jgi:hypothetical protein
MKADGKKTRNRNVKKTLLITTGLELGKLFLQTGKELVGVFTVCSDYLVESRYGRVQKFKGLIETLSDWFRFIKFPQVASNREIPPGDAFKDFLKTEKRARNLVGKKNGPPSDEDEEDNQFLDKIPIGLIQKLPENFSLTLAESFRLAEKGKRGKRISGCGGQGVPRLVIFLNSRCREEIILDFFIGEGIKDSTPNSKIQVGQRDKDDSHECQADNEHVSELERLIDKKVATAFLLYHFPYIIGTLKRGVKKRKCAASSVTLEKTRPFPS